MGGPDAAQRVATPAERVPEHTPERPVAEPAGRAPGLDGAVGNAARARLGDAAPLLEGPLGNAATAALLSRLDRRAHGALGPGVRGPMAGALGAPLDDVAVHTDPEAAELAHRMDAQAVTVGRHVVFGTGCYAPDTAVGRALLGHELAHVVAQRSGSGSGGSGSGGPGSGGPGSGGPGSGGPGSGGPGSGGPGSGGPGSGGSGSGGSAAEHDADRAGALAAAGLPARVAPAAPAVARKPRAEPVTVVVQKYRFTRPDGTVVELPEAEYQAERAKATASLRRDLRRITGDADIWRETHQQHLNEYQPESLTDALFHPKKLIGAAVNIRAGAVPPYIGMWSHPKQAAARAEAALQAGDLAGAARQTQRAQQHLADAKREWNTYLEKSISGGEVLAGELEVVRDVSFAIAIAAAAVVAAPVVATGVAALGVTGAGATALTALGTGVVTGTVGLGLRTGGDVAGQATSGQKVDVRAAARKNLKHLPGDVATGLTAGLAPGVGQAAGLAKTGLTTGGTIARHAVVQGGVAAVSGVAETGVDTARAMVVEGKTWEEAKKETVLPGLKRTAVNVAGAVLTAPLGVAGGRLAQGGRRVIGGAVSHGGGAVVAGGTVLATGGSTRDAAVATGQALITSTALARATPAHTTPPTEPEPAAPAVAAPVPVETEPSTSARPATVETEPAAPVRPVEPEPVVPVAETEPTAPRPDELSGRAANDNDIPPQAARPVEAAELGPVAVANDNAEQVVMTGTGPVVVVPTVASAGRPRGPQAVPAPVAQPAPVTPPQPVASAPQRPAAPPVRSPGPALPEPSAPTRPAPAEPSRPAPPGSGGPTQGPPDRPGRRAWVHPDDAKKGQFRSLPDDVPVEFGPGSGRGEGEKLTSYAEAVRNKGRDNPATAAAQGPDVPYIRDNLYSGKRQTRAVAGLAEHGILEVPADGGSVRVVDPERYVTWLERGYRQHGQAHLDPRMREAILRYVGDGRSIGTRGVDPQTGASSFGGALPGTHAELLAINDLLAGGGTPDAAHVATVRTKNGAHFVACVHCTGIIAQLPPEIRAIVWTGLTEAAP